MSEIDFRRNVWNNLKALAQMRIIIHEEFEQEGDVPIQGMLEIRGVPDANVDCKTSIHVCTQRGIIIENIHLKNK